MVNLQVKTTLPAIGFDFEGLKKWAGEITDQYKDLVVREEDVAGIKSEMAGLNKTKKQLDDARKETVRQISTPIKTFEGQVKEVCALFDKTYRFLGNQVQAYEDRAREDKRREVQFLIDATLHEHKLDGLPLQIQDSWLNKTKKMKAVKAEVEALVLAHLKEMKEAAELEQARTDRAVAIEEKCKALAIEYGFEIPVSTFLRLHDLQTPLADVHGQIVASYEAKQRSMAPVAPPTPPPDAKSETLAFPTIKESSLPKTVKMTLILEYAKINEPKINALIRHLNELAISVNTIT